MSSKVVALPSHSLQNKAPPRCSRAERKTSGRVNPHSAASAATSSAGHELNEGRVVVYEPGN